MQKSNYSLTVSFIYIHFYIQISKHNRHRQNKNIKIILNISSKRKNKQNPVADALESVCLIKLQKEISMLKSTKDSTAVFSIHLI